MAPNLGDACDLFSFPNLPTPAQQPSPKRLMDQSHTKLWETRSSFVLLGHQMRLARVGIGDIRPPATGALLRSQFAENRSPVVLQ